eukprot:CAMPEP_0181127166 /NCGR_PEP_ID=MMETSP1071-20121207/28042_1 /TAXON_ID=35127 /ORGANISM="Thalassiosira sp., Strain NH16" /LENGTH=475 /DNA_ID=CAMNT_0023212865 /DNA_START=19 /DNA_END=1446 /DNA_ORIENTATION=-
MFRLTNPPLPANAAAALNNDEEANNNAASTTSSGGGDDRNAEVAAATVAAHRTTPPRNQPKNDAELDTTNDVEDDAEGNATAGNNNGSVDVDDPHSDPTALKIAEYLDDIECADDSADIASFQDIELPPPKHDAEDGGAHPGSIIPPESPRRAKRFYYCLPWLTMYKWAILGCLAVTFSLLFAIGLSARNVVRGEEALAAALGAEDGEGRGEDGGGDRGEIVINDAPPARPSKPTFDENDGDGDGDDAGVSIDENEEDWTFTQIDEDVGDEELGEELEAIASEFEQAPRDSDPPMAALSPSSWSDPSEPRWFRTTNADYRDFVAAQLSDLDRAMHPYHMAGNFCSRQDLQLCTYTDYCPFGEGNAVYRGGPPKPELHTWNDLEETQWAPFYTDEKDVEGDWVQVGVIPESEGSGGEDDGYGRCYRYGAWSNGIGGTFDLEVTEDHRQWILCCQKGGATAVEEGGEGEGTDEVGET